MSEPHRFRVGDLAITCNGTLFAEFNGSPAVIVGEYLERLGRDVLRWVTEPIWCYRVRVLALTGDDFEVLCTACQLRPIRDEDDIDKALLTRAGRLVADEEHIDDLDLLEV